MQLLDLLKYVETKKISSKVLEIIVFTYNWLFINYDDHDHHSGLNDIMKSSKFIGMCRRPIKC